VPFFFLPMTRYNSYRSYLSERFGTPVLRVPVNGGFSCPNRDGTKGTDGCSFCDNRSFSPVAVDPAGAQEQYRAVIGRSQDRYRAFIPYLQPFTNTYGTVERLRMIYEPLLAVEGTVGLAVGTRPDCLPGDILDYLSQVNSRTHLCVELGLQSGHDRTLERVCRRHSVADFIGAVEALHARGIYCAAHVILGLPGETEPMMLETARLLASLPVDGVKIHQCMVVAGTALAREYAAGAFAVLDRDEYVRLAAGFIARLRTGQHIHRLMAQSRPADGLVAPLWSMDKQAFTAAFNRRLEADGIMQGCRYTARPSDCR